MRHANTKTAIGAKIFSGVANFFSQAGLCVFAWIFLKFAGVVNVISPNIKC